ncbi:cobyrinate a,c-diamide synthase [Agarivorans sp. Z349TD_8]|uniref:cobyrinate a,c-diamide synthase n=1 Tax=Agarivorans sp. Z349TD_8 TaxID=3421434 RepID=UPI003D7CF970
MPKQQHLCPALVVAAPSSGSGKTTVVAAIARYFTNLGKTVRVFKTGPDFIDPNFLAFASGQPVYQLDFWMCGEAHCKALVAEAAQQADLILIEGVMGMFDGQCSSADIAAVLGIPVLAVIDAAAMAQTFAAIAFGLSHYRQDVAMYGVFANRVGSAGHAQMLKDALADSLTFCGYLQKNSGLTLPERHLGLVQAEELADLDQRLDLAAAMLAETAKLKLPPPVALQAPQAEPLPLLLVNCTIAIARDKAFSFIYQANLDVLQQLGAHLVFFSPIAGDELPLCDALYLPGGYPELHLQALQANQVLMQQIRLHAQSKPILAECGGMLYLNRSLSDVDGVSAELCGVLDATAQMQDRLCALGLVEADFSGQKLRGHSFHYSKTQSQQWVLCTPIAQSGREMDPVWQQEKLIASYIHWYFPYNPQLVASIFKGEL